LAEVLYFKNRQKILRKEKKENHKQISRSYYNYH